ncbi:hypothetical protein HNY73_007832 [Argiope bruennichi]|uniref:CCHC-type domain-containing protein n=1 Tax=Argiope bruennichi TaxID=94029 RepID=A0A8T0F4I4_ARGBR|nr:hypothetical protein HNY73_007832 [Argiope bruennichi]
METAKKNRTQQRRLFIKACNEFDAEETNLETSDKIIKLKIIEEKAMLMINSEDNVKEFLFSENVEDDVINKEIDESESYIDCWRLLQLKLQQLSIAGMEEVSSNGETLLGWEWYRSTNRRSHDEENQNSKTTTKTDLDSILEFLQDEVQAEEHIILASQNFGFDTKPNFKSFKEKKVANNKHKYGDTRQIASGADLLTSSKEQRQCIFCHNLHNSTDCLKVRKMPMKGKENLVEKSGCCFLCLKPGHQVRKCYSKVTCLGCGKRYHIILCHDINQRTSFSTGKETAEVDSLPNGDQALANVSKSPSVMLLTLTVFIRGDGRKRKARAIINTASQRSYVLKNTAREIKYKRESWEYLQHSLFGGENTGVCKHDVFTLYLTSCDESYNCHFKVLSQPVICESVPPTIPANHLKELNGYGIHVNDDYDGPIEILIGADEAGKHITGGCKSLSCGLTAMETRLGWTIMRRIPQISSKENGISVANSIVTKFPDPDNAGSLSIHVFCDASKTAYATCIYLRSESKNLTSCQLVQWSNVAPLKAITIPRLELFACSIGTGLVQRVIKDLKLGNIPIFFWTDSSTALCWIKVAKNWTPLYITGYEKLDWRVNPKIGIMYLDPSIRRIYHPEVVPFDSCRRQSAGMVLLGSINHPINGLDLNSP